MQRRRNIPLEKKKEKPVKRADPEMTQMLEIQKKYLKQRKDMHEEMDTLNRIEHSKFIYKLLCNCKI